MDKRRGLYLGTEINEKWWRRYKREGMFARGIGDYWWDDEGFYFKRYLTKIPIFIPFSKVSEIKLGKWHSGRWCMGNLIVKIVWRRENLILSSGILVSKYKEDARILKAKLERFISSLQHRTNYQSPQSQISPPPPLNNDNKS